jgi:uncharacterized membrane protein YhiD involved in acid resistance
MDSALSFQDVIKNSFVNMNAGNLMSTSNIAFVLFVTFLMGMFIFFIYKSTFQGVLYTQSYNISLVMVSMVTSLIIMTIASNFVLSLGMVGALSIVRFRTAVKDSMDIVFMFWAISVGIANGAGLFNISVVSSIAIALVLVILTKYKSASSPYLLILHYSEDKHDRMIEYINDNIGRFNLKSKTMKGDSIELTLEIRVRKDDTSFVNELSKKNGVKDAILISYNGDYIS